MRRRENRRETLYDVKRCVCVVRVLKRAIGLKGGKKNKQIISDKGGKWVRVQG